MSGKFTPGPWRVSGYAVIADSPAPGVGGSDDVEHYGGHLIGESINGPNARLISAAPCLLAVCKALLDLCGQGDFRNGVTDHNGDKDEGETIAATVLDEARAVIRKAES